MNILAATDLSDDATAAARIAAGLARKLGDRLVLATVWQPLWAQYPEISLESSVIEKTWREQAIASMNRTADEVRQEGGEVDVRVLDGYPPDQIARFARENDVRMIVVGSHGRTGIARLFMGSVAERTVLLSDRPVLVVRRGGDSAGSRGALDGWLRGQRPLRVVIGLDAEHASAAAIAFVGTLRAAAPCDVTFIHAYWPPGEYERLGLRGARDLFEPDADVVRVLERDLRPFVSDLGGQGAVETRFLPCWGAPGEMLARHAQELGADLLVLGNRRHGAMKRLWLGSTTQPALRAAETSVLCVPAGESAATALPRPLPAIRKVLAATDLSDLGNQAVRHAYALVAGGAGQVTICHVHERKVPDPAYIYPEPAGARSLTTEQVRALEDRLRALVPPEAAARGTETQVTVVDGGDAADVILQTARRVGADAVCMASHGRSGLAKVVLGSVAAKVMRASERPVMVVRRPGG